MTDVIMPKMGDGMEEGTLLEWLKKDGDSVKSGEIIGSIQTDKATLELEAPASGVLSGFLIKGGETVPVGKSIAAILKDGEKLPDGWGSSLAVAQPAESVEPKSPDSASGGSSGDQGRKIPLPAAEPLAPEPSLPDVRSEKETHERVKASPLARKMAAQLGVDLGRVQGSGPGGRVVEKDIRSAGTTGTSVVHAALEKDESVPLNRLKLLTAQRTAESKAQVPHFYVTVEVDVHRLMDLREMFAEEESGKVSVNDFVVVACARALVEMPEVNAEFQGKAVLKHAGVHIGIAAAIDEGLTLPVLKNANFLSLREVATKSRELVQKAKENKLSLDELSGSTFAISNMGMLNVDNFAAIIVQPHAAILAVSTARKQAVVVDDDELEIRWRMNITASYDHRVVDGAIGARFINIVREYLENPTRLLA